MYTQHFGLAAEPFNLTPDPAYLYPSPEHREALAAVQYGLVNGRGFITMIGEVGTGKTTLLYTLLGQLGPEVQAAYIGYTTQSFEDLLASALKDLGIESPPTSKRALLDALNAHLLRRADDGRTTALVIDEAQNLSDETFEELRLLSNFETYSQKLLQMVLVGQPELQERLRQPHLRQLRERVSVRAYINPLSRPETERYIEHRLRRAGGSMDKLFAPAALRCIIARAGGIPRRVNILCHNSLLFAYGRNLPQVSAAVAREAIAEMDERRPGWFRREAVRRERTAMGPIRWGVAVAAAAAVAVFLSRPDTSELVKRPSAAVSNVLTGVPTTVSPAGAEQAHPDAAPAPRADDRLAAAQPPPPAAVPPAPAAVAPAPAAVAPAPAAVDSPSDSARADDAAEPTPNDVMPFIVPRGASLLNVMHDVYGTRLNGPAAEQLLAEILRLNPQVKDVNLILAGDLLHLPRPSSDASAPAPGRKP